MSRAEHRLTQTIHQQLSRRATRIPDATAIVAPDRAPLSYGRLYAHVKETVAGLHSFGIGRGDRVAIVLPNGPEMATAFLGVASGATAATLNPAYRAEEFEFCLADTQAKAVIVQAGIDSAARVVARARGIPVLELSPRFDGAAGLFTLSGQSRASLPAAEAAEPGDVALVLHTSGTTALAKMVPLTHANLLASAANTAATLKLAEEDRCLNVMPFFHIHGLVGALLSSVAAGAAVACTPGFDSERFLSWLEEFRPTWYTAVPTMHQAVLSSVRGNPDRAPAPSLRFIRSCSAPLPANVMGELEDVFKVPVIEAYGMTEAAHQISSNPLPPRERKKESVGLAAGAEVSIMNGRGELLTAGEIGEIVIRGSNVMEGYTGNSTANHESFMTGWFRTGDQGYLDDDGYLFINGRLKEIINRGGEKISPAEVDRVLLDHAAVVEAVSFAVPHPTLGEDIAAAVVLQKNSAVSERELQRFVAGRLAEFKTPRHVLFLDAIPKSASGKLQRLGLAEKVGLSASSRAESGLNGRCLAPRTEIESKMAEIWAEVLGVEQVGIYDNFFDLGGDSIIAARISNRVYSLLQVELSPRGFFEAPTVGDQATVVEKILGNEAIRSAKIQETDYLPRSLMGEPVSLSATQRRLWLFQQLNPDSIAAARPVSIALTGRLDREALERSLSEVVRRHGILRTVYQEQNGEPFQVVLPPRSVHLEVKDLQYLSEREWEPELKRIALKEARKVIDLSNTPFVPILLKLDERKHVLLVITHHIAFDGWSEAVLIRELSTLYEAFVHGKTSPLPDLPIQYADFAVQQHRRFSRDALQTDILYWKKQLEGVPPTLSLPMASSGSNASLFERTQLSFLLPSDFVDQLNILSRREAVTLFMTLLAAFQVLLGRYSQQEDIAVGTVVAARTQAEIEGLIGCFANLLVLRADLSCQPTFRELLQRVRKMALEAVEHQELPFEGLIEALAPERRLTQAPLFQVLFELRNMPQAQKMAAGGLAIEQLSFDFNLGTWALILQISTAKDGLRCVFEFASELFPPETIERMVGHYQTLLRSIVANPDQRITTFQILTEKERRHLLVGQNNTGTNYRQDALIHGLFEEEVAAAPDHVAVIFDDQQLTYRELNERANQLAHYLKNRGVGPEVPVAVYMERSLDMVVALLAILKAGGAYVPLDPAYPRERLAFMLDDAKPPVVLTQQQWAADFSEQPAHELCLDASWDVITRESKQNPKHSATSDALAYIIYTSGSTGKPKGCMNIHRGVSNRLFWMQEAYQLDRTDRVLQKTPFTFDVSVWELFWPLLTGATLVVARPGGHQDASYLVRLIIEQEITAVHFVPSMLQAFLGAEGVEGCSSLKRVFSSGEALSYELQQRFFACLGAELYNLYGPTEAAVDVTHWACQRASDRRMVPIGRPVANTQIYLLDSQLQPVPAQVCGELYIGGVQLARGYLNRPEQTAERFIPNPFSPDSGSRLYRTGDQARYLPDGNIEFLGRIDNQVKLRGFRIELGEIEHVLTRHRAVSDAVVLARRDRPGDIRLVAYVVPALEQSPSTNELQSYLRRKLPDYMIPSAFVLLDELPLSTNGKIDRGRLPEPDTGRPQLEQAFESPRTPAEERLAKIWRELLRTDQVGVYDSFFDLGGHSLLLTQLASRIWDTFQVRLPLRVLFDAPTIEQMALAILKRQVDNTDRNKINAMLAKVTQLSSDEVLQLLKTR